VPRTHAATLLIAGWLSSPFRQALGRRSLKITSHIAGWDAVALKKSREINFNGIWEMAWVRRGAERSNQRITQVAAAMGSLVFMEFNSDCPKVINPSTSPYLAPPGRKSGE